ncbi:Protein of unknown function [Bacillus wiedmannii]|uniref:Uncharacterized protein n=2 Tax=Bacillus cereus group TaxID=86661 RepID=A0A1C4DLH0_BACTU|nr:Protein of unknown function [Bacillus wiedmannii]SCC32178.1 Protein of unknown function [Bacillus thuringiensis]SCL95044.1 Protein of unknown function [Bacillus wiedmannii]SCN08177.1 Protein of unknown function [Bacillus wiedmannii]SCN34454.1 Protein of unknown function [Bacillus wiedmannii]
MTVDTAIKWLGEINYV